MFLPIENSNITYDEIDLIHGKFIPSNNIFCTDSCSNPVNIKSNNIRFFIDIYGVFADFIGAVEKKNDYKMPVKSNCVVDKRLISKHLSGESNIKDLMNDGEFWSKMNAYKWKETVIKELFTLCNGDYFMMLKYYGCNNLNDRITWVDRYFGINSGRNKTIICNDWNNAIKSRNDILISSDLKECELWSTIGGGSSFWWSEIDGNCEDPSSILVKRIKLMKHVVSDLRALSDKTY